MRGWEVCSSLENTSRVIYIHIDSIIALILLIGLMQVLAGRAEGAHLVHFTDRFEKIIVAPISNLWIVTCQSDILLLLYYYRLQTLGCDGMHKNCYVLDGPPSRSKINCRQAQIFSHNIWQHDQGYWTLLSVALLRI